MLSRKILIVAIAIILPTLGVAAYHRINMTHTTSYACGYLAAMRLARPDVDIVERDYCVVYRTNAATYGFNP